MKSVRRLSSFINLHDLPLAWLQLKRQPVRYLVAVTGIGFAALLMFMQLGFQSGLLRSATTFYQALETDLILINPATVNSGSYQQFPQSLLYQALGIEGVEKTIPLYVTNINAQQLGGVKPTSLRVIGFDPNETILDVPAINDQRDLLKTPNFVLFDELGLSIKTGPVAKQFSKGGPLELILSNFSQSFRVMGLFKLGSTFVADSNLIASQATALELAFPQVNLGEISLGLIRLEPSANVVQIQNYLKSLYGDQLQVLTKEELITQERNYWNNVSSFGVIFGFGTIMGLLVGGVVVYQVLYTDVSDHLKEYATLKAMGFSNQFILLVVIQESILLAVSAFIPATLLSAALYAGLTAVSGIRLEMTADKTLLVGSLTMGLCAVASAIAIRKLQDADPASVF
jgi:putative ABC transport system permease protein